MLARSLATSNKAQRLDLSEWVVHFVHARDCDNEPEPRDEDSSGFPFCADAGKNDGYDIWNLEDMTNPLDSCANAFKVLIKIIHDGHIRSGWSFKNGRPTIYGSFAATCFTEMPLYALLDYARDRGDAMKVEPYAIAIRKNEFFALGGRPVIYGTSTKHIERPSKAAWPRFLAPECGIGPPEQYRYVATRLGDEQHDIDWTHEREWRWSIANDTLQVPGLPIWLKSDNRKISRVLVVVQSDHEADLVLNKLKTQIDDGWCEGICEYDLTVLANTSVISIDRVRAAVDIGSMRTIRLEDVPQSSASAVTIPKPSEDYVEQVHLTIERARAAALAAASNFRTEHPGVSWYGSAWIMVHEGQSEFVQALMELNRSRAFEYVRYDAVEAFSRLGYRINVAMEGACETGGLDEEEAAANAAIQVINTEFPEAHAYIYTRDD